MKHEQPGEVKGRGGGKPKDMSKKAILLSGPPGIGKTSSATIVSRSAVAQCLLSLWDVSVTRQRQKRHNNPMFNSVCACHFSTL